MLVSAHVIQTLSSAASGGVILRGAWGATGGGNIRRADSPTSFLSSSATAASRRSPVKIYLSYLPWGQPSRRHAPHCVISALLQTPIPHLGSFEKTEGGWRNSR